MTASFKDLFENVVKPEAFADKTTQGKVGEILSELNHNAYFARLLTDDPAAVTPGDVQQFMENILSSRSTFIHCAEVHDAAAGQPAHFAAALAGVRNALDRHMTDDESLDMRTRLLATVVAVPAFAALVKPEEVKAIVADITGANVPGLGALMLPKVLSAIERDTRLMAAVGPAIREALDVAPPSSRRTPGGMAP